MSVTDTAAKAALGASDERMLNKTIWAGDADGDAVPWRSAPSTAPISVSPA